MLTSCQGDKIDSVKLSADLNISTVGACTAQVILNTGKIADYAYIVYNVSEFVTEPSASVIYRSGTIGECVDGENVIEITGLDVLTTYVICLACRTTDGEYYDEIFESFFTTTDFTDTVTIFNVDYDSFKVHLIIPASVSSAGNALRYFYSDIFTYNTNKMDYGYTDAENLSLNGGVYTLTDCTVSFYSGDDDDDYVLNDPIAPGQPGHFVVGEFAYGNGYFHANDGYWIWQMDDTQWAYDNGYLSDEDYAEATSVRTKSYDESDYWYGYYSNTIFETTKPALLDGSLNISTIMYATRGYIIFEPTDNVYSYTVLILDDATYNELMPYLEDNEDYLQWFVTSYAAYYYLGSATASGTGYLTLESFLYPEPLVNYHIMAVGMGNASGTTQFFEHIIVSTTERSGETPEIVITPLSESPTTGEASPYEAWFNIKCTTKNMDYGYYAANYVREWESALRSSDYSTLCESAYEFTTTEVAAINTDDGYSVCIQSRAGSTTRLAVLAYNDEDLPNNPDAADTQAVAENTTIDEIYGDRIESALFTSLPGEWTMSLSVYNDETVYSWPITISDGLYVTEELTEADYALYASDGIEKTKEETDALFAELKEECATFTEMVQSRNHLLVTGWGGNSQMEYQSPYQLFVSEDYSGATNWAVVYDFGPKWYIEVLEDGSIAIPINTRKFYPTSSWETLYGSYQEQYLMGKEPEASYTGYLYEEDVHSTLYFPATLSEDGNTITISPLTVDGVDYYLSVGKYYSSGGYFTYPYGKTNSDIVLTRGWTSTEQDSEETAEAAARKATARTEKCPVVDFHPHSGVKSMTPLVASPKFNELGTLKVVDHQALRECVEAHKIKRD